MGNKTTPHVHGTPTVCSVISKAHFYDEAQRKTRPRRVRYLTAGQDHVAAVLATRNEAQGYGDDLFVWGSNKAFQLATGKHSNESLPTSPSSKLLHLASEMAAHNDDKEEEGATSCTMANIIDAKEQLVQLREGARIYCGDNVTVLY